MSEKAGKAATLGGAALTVLFSATAAFAVPGDQTEPYEGSIDHPTEDCFWISVGNDRLWNYVNTDSNAVYQCSSYHLPEKSKLVVKGEFPHSRYFTFTLYGSVLGNFYVDQDIVPNPGSINPFIYGNDRSAGNRSYTIHMESGFGPEDPKDRPPNTLYHGNPMNERFGNVVCTRIYVPDKGMEPFGDTELPEVTLVKEDGTELKGEQMCKAIEAKHHGFGVPPQAIGFDLKKYLALREGSRISPKLPQRPHTHPAQNPPQIKAFFNAKYTQCSFFTPEKDCGAPTYNPDGVGLGNPASRYLETYLDQGFGRVLVIRGKLPKTPKTWNGNQVVPDEDYDLRYFSFCPQESLATWRVGDCIFDEELAHSLDEKGFYTAVFSRPSYRPRNARPECGFTWTSTPPAGDGAGDFNLYNMWIRSALPSPNYKQYAGNILTPDTEEEVMGDYYPRGEYMSVEEFEALGCPSKTAKK
jgi:hypothetical protein